MVHIVTAEAYIEYGQVKFFVVERMNGDVIKVIRSNMDDAREAVELANSFSLLYCAGAPTTAVFNYYGQEVGN